MILKNNAVQNESTANPPTILVHSKIMIAFITNKNSPKVITVTGKVKITNIGFINRFSNPKTIATIIAVVKLATCTPGKRFAINKTKAAVTRSLSNSFIFLWFKFLIKVIKFLSKSLLFQKPSRQFKKHFRIFGMKPMSCIWNSFKLDFRKVLAY